jgi:diguanylate cyclase (GGDEF)-like protein
MIRPTFEELKATGHLPSPSGVGMRILKLTQDDSHSAEEISRTIMADSALTGRLLKLANSAMSGSSVPITTVPEATVRLGLSAVKSVALGLSIVSAHRGGACPGFDYERYWAISLARAVAAHNFSQQLHVGLPAEAYVSGLLAEIGRLALASVYPQEYGKLLAGYQGTRASDLARTERDQFEIDHGEVGAYMLEDWGLPPAFSRAVQLYEQRPEKIAECPDRATQALAKVVHWAQALAEICLEAGSTVDGDATGMASALEDLRQSLVIDTDPFQQLCVRISNEWVEWGKMLEVPTSRLATPLQIQARASAQMATPASTDVIRPAPARGVMTALRVLAVDDDPMSLMLLARTLEKAGHEVQTAANGSDALQQALETSPQVVIADWMMPEMDGLELCRALRRIESGRNMFFLLLTGRGEEDRIVEAFDAGVDDYVHKPFNARVLMARIKGGQRVLELQERVESDRKMILKQVAELGLMTRKLRNAALTDVLTEMPNRRYAMKRLETDWDNSTRTGAPLSLIMIDIDHFKKINDTHGHDVGDLVLKETASIMRRTTRQGEEVSRLGGEEFVVICPNTNEAQAAVCAERLRAAVERNVVRTPNFTGSVTISLGVAQRTPEMPNFDSLLKAADDAVYGAKTMGRNRHLTSTSHWNKARPA